MNRKLYLQWKGAADAGMFTFYNKEKWENETYNFDTINIQSVGYTVKGWDEGSNSQIYSNVIESFNEEELKIRSKGWTLFEGRYDKKATEELGAKLHIQVVGIDDNGDEIVVELKGKNYFNLSEVLKNRPQAIKFDRMEDGKIGAVEFKSPFFVATDLIETPKVAEDINVADLPF